MYEFLIFFSQNSHIEKDRRYSYLQDNPFDFKQTTNIRGFSDFRQTLPFTQIKG